VTGDISVMISGKAGDGVLFTGNVLARVLRRLGWEVVTTRDFPSNIRGEPTNYTIRASLNRIYGRADWIDVLMAFDCDSVVEVLSPCVIHNRVNTYSWYREHILDVDREEKYDPRLKEHAREVLDDSGKLVTGLLYKEDRPCFGDLVLPGKRPLVRSQWNIQPKKWEKILEKFR